MHQEEELEEVQMANLTNSSQQKMKYSSLEEQISFQNVGRESNEEISNEGNYMTDFYVKNKEKKFLIKKKKNDRTFPHIQ